MKLKYKISNNIILIILLIIISVFFSLTGTGFFKFTNISIMLKSIAVTGILALGLTPLMIARGIDISFGSSISLVTVVMALIYGGRGIVEGSAGSGVNLWLALIIGVLIATFIGFLNGILIETFNLDPLILTLGMMAILQAIALVLSNASSIPALSDLIYLLSNKTVFNISLSFIISIILFVIYWFILRFTRFGKNIYAIGGNPMVAKLYGIEVKKIKVILYTIMGFFTGIAAVIVLIMSGTGSPYHGLTMLFPALSAVLLGGIAITGGNGNIWGTLLGVLIIGILFNGLKNMNTHYYIIQIIQGLAFIIIVSSYEIRKKIKNGV